MRGFSGDKVFYILVSCHSPVHKACLLSPTSFLGLFRALSESKQTANLTLVSHPQLTASLHGSVLIHPGNFLPYQCNALFTFVIFWRNIQDCIFLCCSS